MRILPALLSVLAVALCANGQVYVSAYPPSPPAAAAKPADSVALSGTVVDGNGAPVAGAAVRAYERDPNRPTEDTMTLRGEAVTKADGAFELPLPPRGEEQEIGLVLAGKKGLSLGWGAYWSPQSSRDLKITLRAPAAIGGSVVDESGKPVAGAKVLAVFVSEGERRGSSYATGYLSVDWLVRTTDASGRFTFADMPAQEAKADFNVLAEGFAPAQTHDRKSREPVGQFSPGQGDIKIVLVPEARVEGLVLDKATGRPVAGAPIALTTVSFLGTRRAQSDANGRFVLAGLPAGNSRLCYAAAGLVLYSGPALGVSYGRQSRGPAEWVSPIVTVDLAKGQTAGAKLELAKGAILHVAVRDKVSEGPLAGAWVTLRDDANCMYHGQSDANGMFSLRVLPGTYTLTYARKEGYGSVYGMRDEAQKAAILRAEPSAVFATVTADAVEGQTAVLAAALAPEPRITGIVKDRSGKPVAGAEVGSLFGFSQFGGGLGPRTDANGIFSLPSDVQRMQPFGDAGVTVMARDPNRGLVGASQAAPGEPVEITVLPGVTATGLVTDPNGTPIPKARVRLVIWYGRSGMGQPAEPAGADGRYRLGPLIPGVKYTVQADAPGYGQASETLHPQGDEPNGAIAVPNLVLPLARLTLSGIVLDADGNTVAKARIYVQGQGQAFRDAESDEKGRWKVSDIIDGRVDISAQSNDPQRQAYGRATARGGEANVVIVVRDRRGTVASPPRSLAGKPMPDLRKLGLQSAEELAGGKRILLVLWDSAQRPSRRCAAALAARADELKGKGLAIVLVHAPTADANAPAQWLAEQRITLPTGVIPSDAKAPAGADPLAAWGAKGLPWLVLTDEKLIVRQEGFALEELDAKLPGPAAPKSAAPSTGSGQARPAAP